MKPTHSELKVLAGNPLILAASDEQYILAEWEKRDRVFKAAMRAYALWKRRRGVTDKEALRYTDAAPPEANDLIRACAAARKR